jgi:hypothetical protein|tara:strand:+ start:912 stop:1154 length:243 start_codon:yes stop_codon:yes gene_type:complete
MEKLQEDFENSLLEIVNEYDKKGLSTHDQISILSYIYFELCNKIFMDVRIGYTHILSLIMQRILFDMHDDGQENTKKILH